MIHSLESPGKRGNRRSGFDPKIGWQMCRNATHPTRLEFRRGGAGVPRDDGRGWCERTAHRSPRSDTGFETAHGEGTNL